MPLCTLCNRQREGLGWRDQQRLILLVCHTKSLFLPPGWAPVRKTNSINMMAGKRQASWHLALQLFRHSNSSVWFIRHCCGSGRHQSSPSYRQVWGPWLGSARTCLQWTAGEVRMCLQVLAQQSWSSFSLLTKTGDTDTLDVSGRGDRWLSHGLGLTVAPDISQAARGHHISPAGQGCSGGCSKGT